MTLLAQMQNRGLGERLAATILHGCYVPPEMQANAAVFNFIVDVCAKVVQQSAPPAVVAHALSLAESIDKISNLDPPQNARELVQFAIAFRDELAESDAVCKAFANWQYR